MTFNYKTWLLFLLLLATPFTSAEATPSPLILDISHYQDPSEMDYDKLSEQISLVIIRVQSGLKMDTAYRTHIEEFQKRGIPVNVYGHLQAETVAEAKAEANALYNRTKPYDIPMYWVDVEGERSVEMNPIVTAFTKELRSKVDDDVKIGAYIAVELYETFNLDTELFDGIWIPKYNWGNDQGTYDGIDPIYVCDIHQYTENGRLDGYPYALDLNRLTYTNNLDINYFGFKNETQVPLGSFGITTGTVNFRKGSGTDTAILDRLKKGTIYQVIDQKGSWLKVEVNDQQGWISGKYGQPHRIPAKINANRVNLRANLTTDSPILTTLAKDTRLVLIGESGGWYYVKAGDHIGWVYSPYVSPTS